MIRDATVLDVGEMTEIGDRFYSEAPNWAGVRPDRKQIEKILILSITQGSCWIDVGDDGQIRGGLACVNSPAWFSTEPMLVDLCLYVRPEHRNSILGARLVRHALKFAKRAGIPRIRFGVTTGIDDDLVGKLYETLGFRRVPSALYERIL